MEFTKEQRKIINCKSFGMKFIKGAENTGKTVSAIERVVFLKNNYTLYDEDKILYLVCNKDKKSYIENLIKDLDNSSNFKNISIFSLMNREIEVYNINDLVHYLYKKIKNLNNEKFCSICSEKNKEEIILEILNEKIREYSKVRFIKLKDIDFIKNEIKLIKNMDIRSYDEYACVKRTGKIARKYRVNKNSLQRRCLYNIFKEYNKELDENNYVDYEDMIIYIIENKFKEYVHIAIDYCENLTSLELKLIKSLINKKVYSDEIYIMHDLCENYFSPIINGKRIFVKNLGINVKRFNLKKEIKKDYVINEISEKNIIEEQRDLMEHFTFLDLRHRREFQFNRDYNKIDDIIVMDQGEEVEYEKNELKEIPVYSNIAAGQPIMISSEQEGRFFLPQYWVKGQKECFILKIKGDSMINANINHGDYVIIRKQSIAENKDIVAVELDGSATLKRLYINKGRVQLLPENEKYSPINICEEDNISILGVALGVISRK